MKLWLQNVRMFKCVSKFKVYHFGSITTRNKNIKLNVGSCLIFSGQNTHKGQYLEKGTRYILTGFINYGGKDTCQDYIQELAGYN